MPSESSDPLNDDLHRLRLEHRALKAEIEALEDAGGLNDLLLRRLKKQKLALKDRITQVEQQLLPNIIA